MKKCILIATLCLFSYTGIIAENNSGNTINSNTSIEFVENKGQWVDCDGNAMPDIKFMAKVEGREVYVRNSGLSFVLQKFEPDSAKIKEKKQDALLMDNEMEPGTVYTHRMDIEFSGANNIAQISGIEKLPQYNNYYYPHCADGITHVPAYAKVEYNNVYDNIDLMVYANEENSLEYDFIVKPGAKPQQIKLKLIESGNTELSSEGNLIAETILGKIEQMKPYTYQMVNGVKKEIKSSFVLNGNEISFEVDDYDKDRELVIDPETRVWGSYFGGPGADYGFGVTTDDDNNVYFVGATASENNGNNIASKGSHQEYLNGGTYGDIFLMKMNKEGKRQWSTYYGGSESDIGRDVAVDYDKNIYITGWTLSPNDSGVIATPGSYKDTLDIYADVILIKFDSNGIREWGTYYGGEDTDKGFGITIDIEQHILITGKTVSTYGISKGDVHQLENSGSEDAFISKFNLNGKQIWGTYYGGEYGDVAAGIVTDTLQNIYITGATFSETGISTKGAHQEYYNTHGPQGSDAFISKFNLNGKQIWGTYYGGSWLDAGTDFWGGSVINIALDQLSNIIIASYCWSSDGLVTDSAYQTTQPNGSICAFISKFNTAGTRLWGTVYGGFHNDVARNIAIDRNNYIYFCGNSSSGQYQDEEDYISTEGSIQEKFSGNYDAMIVKLSPDGKTRKWGTFYGGSDVDVGHDIIVDQEDNIYVIGETRSTTNIATQNAYQSSFSADRDAFMLKIHDPTINIKNIDGIFVGGNRIDVTFETFIDFETSKDYYLQISDPDGRFIKPINCEGKGSVSGNVTAFLPDSIDYSSNYRFRVIAENPLTTIGLPSEEIYTVYPKPEMDILGKKVVVTGYQETYIVDYRDWISNIWSVTSGEIVNEDSNGITILWTEAGKGSIKLSRTIENAGYSDSTELIVKIYDKPDMEIAGLNEVCADDTTNYVISFQSNITTEWEVINGDIISDNDSLITVIWTLEGTGKVKLTCSIEDGEYIDSNNIDVTIHLRPEKPTIEQEGSTLVSSSESGNQWYQENILIPEAIGSTYIPDESGNYTVRVTNEFSCESDYSDVFEYTKTGIYESTETDGIQIYPNPSNGEITIELNDPANGSVDIKLINILGTEFKAFICYDIQSRIFLDINDLPYGTYFLKINIDLKQYIFQVIKQ